MADNTKLLTTISDKQLQAILIAKSVFSDKKLNLTGYNILLSESKTDYIVIFEHSSKSPGLRGSPSGNPGLAVNLDKETLEIINSHFIR
ncbi:MAG TPA: hypothetical protein VIM41_04550 [Gammaproteobacteria bacterium]